MRRTDAVMRLATNPAARGVLRIPAHTAARTGGILAVRVTSIGGRAI